MHSGIDSKTCGDFFAGCHSYRSLPLHAGIISGHPVYITDNENRLIAISPCIPLQMNRGPTDEWLLEDFDLIEEIYKGKASIVFKVR